MLSIDLFFAVSGKSNVSGDFLEQPVITMAKMIFAAAPLDEIVISSSFVRTNLRVRGTECVNIFDVEAVGKVPGISHFSGREPLLLLLSLNKQVALSASEFPSSLVNPTTGFIKAEPIGIKSLREQATTDRNVGPLNLGDRTSFDLFKQT